MDSGGRIVAALLYLSMLALRAQSADILTGKLADVAGEVEVQKRGSASWTPARSGMAVGPGDQINTGLTGKASLVFTNSVTEIQPLTQFVVGRAFEDKSSVTTELFLQVGKVVSNVDPKSAKANKFTVTTPTAVAGVRGTRQECRFDRGFGTEVKISEGAGYMAPVRAEKLPPAVQAMLGMAPAGGGREGGVGRGDEKGGKGGEKKEAPKTVSEAVAEFNAWIQQAEQSLGAPGGGEAAPILDPQTLDFVVPIADGLSATIQSATDPKGITDATAGLVQSVAPSVLPAGTSAAEEKAAQQSTEVVDAPVTVTVVEAKEAVKAAVKIQETTTLTTITTTVTPPNRPALGQDQGK